MSVERDRAVSSVSLSRTPRSVGASAMDCFPRVRASRRMRITVVSSSTDARRLEVSTATRSRDASGHVRSSTCGCYMSREFAIEPRRRGAHTKRPIVPRPWHNATRAHVRTDPNALGSTGQSRADPDKDRYRVVSTPATDPCFVRPSIDMSGQSGSAARRSTSGRSARHCLPRAAEERGISPIELPVPGRHHVPPPYGPAERLGQRASSGGHR